MSLRQLHVLLPAIISAVLLTGSIRSPLLFLGPLSFISAFSTAQQVADTSETLGCIVSFKKARVCRQNKCHDMGAFRLRRRKIEGDSKLSRALQTDVHTQISKRLRAYSVFPPVLEDHFELFQVVLLGSSRESRAESPRSTPGNLQTIISRLHARLESSRSQGYDIGLDKSTLEDFMHEFEEVSIPTPYDHEGEGSMTITVSEASLAKAGVNLQVGQSLNAGVGFSRYEVSLRQLRLSEISSEAYNGGGELRKLIWDHSEAIFSLILEEIDMDLGTAVGDRSLVAVVTKKICANVGVSRTDVTTASFGASSPDGGFLSARAGVEFSNVSHEDFDAHHGISGVHFIVFPVEVVGQFRWRFYRGIDLRDAEPQDDSLDEMMARRDHFLQSQKWHRKDVNQMSSSSDHQDIRRGSPEASTEMPMSPTSEEDSASVENGVRVPCGKAVSVREGITPKCSSSRGGEEWIDVFPANNPVPWVDIDLKDCLGEFAFRQCALGAEYRALPCTHAQEHGVRLLRSSLCKACPESIVRASCDLSECYEHGLGVLRSQSMAKELRSWSETMREDDVSLTFWCEFLSHDDTFLTSLEPEKRVLEMIADREMIPHTLQQVQVAEASPNHVKTEGDIVFGNILHGQYCDGKTSMDGMTTSQNEPLCVFILQLQLLALTPVIGVVCVNVLLGEMALMTSTIFLILAECSLVTLLSLVIARRHAPMRNMFVRTLFLLLLPYGFVLVAYLIEEEPSIYAMTQPVYEDYSPRFTGMAPPDKSCSATRHLTEVLGYCAISNEALDTV